MPRRNRPPERLQPQHGKPSEKSKRPRRWHRSIHSPEADRAVDALARLQKAEGT